ncbi:hypothetical protein V1264_018796 [Littorina saxatilis]|uniref:IgGFc-binding protein N-terminal domain-containing protein n=1 Tax=Littorina saxatilis TaxID=31220 RepID=A0AAN9BDI5_9CAEN
MVMASNTDWSHLSMRAGGQFTKLYENYKDQVLEQFLPWEAAAGHNFILGRDTIYSPKNEIVKVITKDIGTTFVFKQETHTSTETRQTFVFTRKTGDGLAHLTSAQKILVATITEHERAGDQVMFIPLPVSSWATREYEMFVAAKFDMRMRLVLVAEFSSKDHLVITGGGFSGDIHFSSKTILVNGTNYTEMTAALTRYQDFLLNIRCQRTNSDCGHFHGYLYGYNLARAWSIPLMPELHISQSNLSSLVTDMQV